MSNMSTPTKTYDRLSIEELSTLIRQVVADIAAGRNPLYRNDEEFIASLGIAGPVA